MAELIPPVDIVGIIYRSDSSFEEKDKLIEYIDYLQSKDKSNDESFESWWSGYWKPTSQPAVFDAAMKEIAKAAWDGRRSATPVSNACSRMAEGTLDPDACCENESRNRNGGCDNCGDPCL